MSFNRLVNKAWSENILFSVLIELTYRCNLDCFFCYNDLGLRGRSLDEGQYHRLLDELAELGVLNLTFSGGEPLAHPAFFPIASQARELGFLIRIKSNGHALGDRIAARLRDEVDPFVIDISLHGASAATHDRQTCVSGSFDRLIRNLRRMKAHDMRLKLNGVLTAWNEHELESMYALADELEIPLSMDATVTPRDDGDTSPTRIRPSEGAIQRLCEFQAGREPERFLPSRQDTGTGPSGNTLSDLSDDRDGAAADKHCGAGSSSLAIDPFGNIFPCVQWRRPLGNLHEQSITELWKDATTLTPVRQLGPRIKVMVQGFGDAAPHVAFCPGLAELQTESPLTAYPAAREKLGVVRELQTRLAASQRPVAICPQRESE